jgi:N-acetylglutamate synthase-like GNAT family acetyltransferase
VPGVDLVDPKHAVRIRRAVTEDADGILDCLSSAFAPYRRTYTREAYAATVLTRPLLNERLQSMTVFVAIEGAGRIVGTAAIQETSRQRAFLRGMAVRPAYQGTDLAASLLRRAVRLAREHGHSNLYLYTTQPLERAIGFYLKHGFRTTRRNWTWCGMKLIGFKRTLAAHQAPRIE